MLSLRLLPSFLLLTIATAAQTAHTTVTTTATQQATTLTSTSTRTTSTTITPSASSDPSWTDDSHFKSSCVNSTNIYRAQHDVPVVTWNDTLAEWAARWSSKCLWAHSGLGYGENLAEGFANVADAVGGWANERDRFDFANAHFTEQTGHFSQVIWKGSTSMGCARTYCDVNGQQNLRIVARSDDEKAFGWLFVCEYWPPGNVNGQFKQNVPSQVSNGDPVHGLIGGGGRSAQGFIGMATTPRCNPFTVAVVIALSLFFTLH